MAVSAVLLFHAFPGHLHGGFVGVDVFFVISGFLISGIILGKLELGTFAFLDFYDRRIRRIFPALTVVCGATLLFGWFTLLPSQFPELGKHVLGGALFSANFVLLGETGYFDTKSTLKPLLHLWSLGIEEQYYLVWPALLVVFRKRDGATKALLLTLALVSFAFNIYLTSTNRAAAYYLPLTRFWELMIGSGLAYLARASGKLRHSALGAGSWLTGVRRRRGANVLSFLGVSAIGVAVVLIRQEHAFPGWWALLPCLGTALVIAAGPHAWINHRILGSRPVVWIGLISYPLYLWHWPLLAYSNIMMGKPPASYRIGLLVLAVFLAWLTYVFLELPIRHGRSTRSRPGASWKLLQAMSVVAILGFIVNLGWISSASAHDKQMVAIADAMDDWDGFATLTVPGSVKDTVLFFGDSHMEQYWPRVETVINHSQNRRTVEFRTLGGCAPMPTIDRYGRRCGRFVAEGFGRAAEPDVSIVVLAAQWIGLVNYKDYYLPADSQNQQLNLLGPESAWIFDDFARAMGDLRKRGKRVVVLLSSPAGDSFDPMSMVDFHHLVPRAKKVDGIPRSTMSETFSPIDQRIRLAARQAGAEILEPMDWFCDNRICPVQGADGSPVSKDGSHIRASVVRARAGALDDFVLVAPASGL